LCEHEKRNLLEVSPGLSQKALADYTQAFIIQECHCGPEGPRKVQQTNSSKAWQEASPIKLFSLKYLMLAYEKPRKYV
jgi:hypothetical protein